MERRKILVLATAALALVFLGGAGVYRAFSLPSSFALDTRGQPTIGEGQIEMVLIEDLRCANCRTFSEEVFPRIAERYIETGEARFTVIPVAFIEGSKPLGNAALCVNHTSSDRFFPFIQELFRMDGSSKHEILRAARRAGGIDLHALGRCIDTREYYDELEENYHAAKRLMGRQFGTPALYVDGIPTSTASFEAVENRIAQLEKRR